MTERDTIRAALSYIPAYDRELWLRIGMAIKAELGDDGFDLWHEWSQQDESYNAKDARTVWKSIRENGRVTIATLYHEAKAHGWRDDGGHQIPTPEELAERKRLAAERAAKEEAETARARAKAAKKSAVIWKAAAPVSADHPYLQAKRVSSVVTLREIDASKVAAILGYTPKSRDEPLSGRLLVVPVKIGKALSTLELIDPDGRKAVLAGRGTKTGGYWAAQPLPESNGDGLKLLVGEGVATVLSGKEVSGHPSIATLSAGNLPTVAKTMRQRYPAAVLVILADLVKATGEPDAHAVEAVRAVGGLLAIPDFGTVRPDGAKDFNDMAQLCGIDAVRDAIANAKAPATPELQPGAANAPGGESHVGKFDKETVEKLAKLSPFDYDRARETEAARLGVRVPTLDAEVRKARGEPADDTGQGQAFAIESPEPWPDPINGADLLNDIASIYRRYVLLPEHADVALALWTVHTYAYDCRRCTPILVITSPQKRCGKTTLMSVLLGLVNSPLGASNISPSCVFRSIDKWQPTLLIDEADSFIKDNEELRGILNSGHTRELAYVIRAVGDEHEPRRFSTWCPKAIALIGKLPPTLHDRTIEIPLARKTAIEAVARFNDYDGTDVQRKCVRWVSDHAAELYEADPTVPQELHDRAADNWRPLAAIANLAGGEWPDLARDAAIALTGTDDDTESYAIMLLADIRELFEERETDRLFSEVIVEHLHTLEDRPWPQWGRSQKPITKTQVARLLKAFKIRPGQIWNAGKNERGYELKQLTNAFSRYLPPIQTARPLDASNDAASGEIQTAREKEFLADGKPLKPTPGAGSSGLAVQKVGIDERDVFTL